MAGSVNKVILIGNLGKDPRVSRTNSGDQVVNFSLATSETWRDKATGERKESTEWHNVVVFNENIGRVVEQYCKKGAKVYVEGQLQTRKWTDQSGVEKYTTEVVLQRFRGELTLLDSRGAGGEGRDSFAAAKSAPRASAARRRSRPSGRPCRAAAAATSTTTFRSERARSPSPRELGGGRPTAAGLLPIALSPPQPRETRYGHAESAGGRRNRRRLDDAARLEARRRRDRRRLYLRLVPRRASP